MFISILWAGEPTCSFQYCGLDSSKSILSCLIFCGLESPNFHFNTVGWKAQNNSVLSYFLWAGELKVNLIFFDLLLFHKLWAGEPKMSFQSCGLESSNSILFSLIYCGLESPKVHLLVAALLHPRTTTFWTERRRGFAECRICGLQSYVPQSSRHRRRIWGCQMEDCEGWHGMAATWALEDVLNEEGLI